jgi:GNAT superfamily N-acetyltransferase
MSQVHGMLLRSQVGMEMRMRVVQWDERELPERAVGILREELRGRGEPDHELSMTVDLARSESGLTFVALDSSRPVGILVAGAQARTRSAFVRWLVVRPSDRGRGVGTALVDALASTPGVERLTGMVDQHDPVALGFWRASGWTIQQSRPGRRRQLMGIDSHPALSEAA